MKSAVRFVPWLLLLVALIFIGLDYRTTSILRSENNGLKATLQAREAELTRLRAATDEVTRLQQLQLAPPPPTGTATPPSR